MTEKEERAKVILEKFVQNDYHFIFFVDLKSLSFEFHRSDSALELNLPETGNALELRDFIAENYADEDSRKDFMKFVELRNLKKQLKRQKSVRYDHSFAQGFTSIEIMYYDKKKLQLLFCCKVEKFTGNERKDNEPEALMILALDERKRFTIRNINENVSKLYNVSLLQYMKGFQNDAFAGYHPDDRVKAEKLFMTHAFDGAEFSGSFRVSAVADQYLNVRLEVKVRKLQKSYIYYVTLRRENSALNSQGTVVSESSEELRSKVHAFDIDLASRTAHLGLEMRKYYNWSSVVSNFPYPFISAGVIKPEDGEQFVECLDNLMKGSIHEEFDVRMRSSLDDEYEWRRLSFTAVLDDRNTPVRALIYSENISYIKEQEERFRSVLELCGFTSWNFNLEKHYIYNTTRINELFGFEGKQIADVPNSLINTGIIHKEDREEFRRVHEEILAGAKTAECEFRGMNIREGKYLWYRLRYTVVTDEKGKPLYAVGTTTDINEQKIAEISYENEARTLSAMQGDNLLEKCCINATKNIVTNYNSRKKISQRTDISYTTLLKEMMTYCSSDLHAQVLWNRLRTDVLLESFNNGDKTFSFVYRRQSDNNNLQWVSTKVNMYQDPKSGDIMCFIYTYDINRRKVSQEALEMIGTADFEVVGVVDVISGGVFFLHDNNVFSSHINWDSNDYDSILEQFADRKEKQFSTKEDEIILREKVKISNLVRELNGSDSYEVLIKIHSSRNNELITYRSTFRYLDEEHSNILFCLSDITSALAEERTREEILKDALEQAKIASKAKSNFLARMSHDIRTPLNGIMGMTQLAMDETDIDVIHSYLEKIDASSHFLLGLLNDVLDMSRIEKGKIVLEEEIYSLQDFREDIDSIINPICRNKDIHLNVQIPGDTEFITDKQKFNQIFFNLLSNSIKFSSVGGTIDLIAENMETKDGRFEVDFVVRDYGCGMTEEFQKHMFEAFSQERNTVISLSAGTGLGLAIVKSFVDKMGGTIRVESSTDVDNHGTKTMIHLSLKLPE